ncbi:MAG: 2-amino-4-hydroxy-6-hydroxymethyldihydropteridine diphosphokinase [Methylococcaceae bacterium]|nr:2-amino-4-hydroxy-6-hydroxymethyldihydropteridine diphosphokinase [Methylococcaceae bacterium]MCI0667429.1 2-amino-4-hydroxy-6-hydroxymethyldihydropteridine diphosphokinase [Methylococcaceae bacterium]MCI0734483.1 2-amino-4-hydroxy-6-hydroxymethyldihydropteridine diphosphokinase [Methylococcaceae bacterium]
MPGVYLSIGSNIDREKNISSALREIRALFGDLTLSSVYETDAVGFEGPPFYNMTIRFESEKPLREIARTLREIEIRHGRTHKCVKFSGRTLDLDILLYGDLVISDGKLQIPRDDIIRYAFVLEPLAEIAPAQHHPVTHDSFLELWEKFDKAGLRQKIVEPSW